MRDRLLLVVAAIGLAGCGPTSPGGLVEPVTVPPVQVRSTPPELEPGSLALERDGDKVQVGAKVDDALTVFPKPSEKDLNTADLPRGYPPETYSAQGWESLDGSEGFGMITVTVSGVKKVAVAIRTARVDSREAADAIVASYQSQFEALAKGTQVSGQLTYAFWEDSNNRLMILEAPAPGGKCQLTLALGAQSLLLPLRIDRRLVGEDIMALAKDEADAPKTEPSKR